MAMKMLINSREVSDRPIHDRDDDDWDHGAVSEWVGCRIKKCSDNNRHPHQKQQKLRYYYPERGLKFQFRVFLLGAFLLLVEKEEEENWSLLIDFH